MRVKQDSEAASSTKNRLPQTVDLHESALVSPSVLVSIVCIMSLLQRLMVPQLASILCTLYRKFMEKSKSPITLLLRSIDYLDLVMASWMLAL